MTFFSLFKSSFLLLKKENIDISEFDLKYFICSIFDISNQEFLLRYHQNINNQAKLRLFQKSLNLLLTGLPMAYVLETEFFFDRAYYCPKGVLIPRSETEILVETVSAYISKHKNSSFKVYECGSGTGCISIELALRFSDIYFKSFDIDITAVQVAKKNAKKFAVSNVSFFHDDFFDQNFSNINSDEKILLVSNPPYVSEQEWMHISSAIKNYEPKQAFVSQKNGFDHLYKLIDIATKLSCPAFLEIGYRQSDTLLSYTNKGSNPYFIKDYQGIKRILCLGDPHEME